MINNMLSGSADGSIPLLRALKGDRANRLCMARYPFGSLQVAASQRHVRSDLIAHGRFHP
jgi:hypothetical protein